MRVPDDPDPRPVTPLDHPTPKSPPPRPEWTQVPGAPKGIEQDKDGHMRSNIPLSKLHFWGKL